MEFWMKLGHSEYIVRSSPWQILGAIRAAAEARAGERAEVFFCQVYNARIYRFPVSQIHEICTEDVVLCRHESFQKTFMKICRGSFFQKGNFSAKIFNDFGLQAATKSPIAFRTRLGPMNHVLHEVQMPTWEGATFRGKQANHCKYRHSAARSVSILTMVCL